VNQQRCPVCLRTLKLGVHLSGAKDLKHLEYYSLQKERVRTAFLAKQSAKSLANEEDFYLSVDWIRLVWHEFFTKEQIREFAKVTRKKVSREGREAISRGMNEYYSVLENREKHEKEMNRNEVRQSISEGTSKTWTDERRKEHGEIMSSRDLEYISRMQESLREWYAIEENYDKFCERMKEIMGTDEMRAKNSLAQIECQNRPEVAKHNSEKQIERFSRQEERDAQSLRLLRFNREHPEAAEHQRVVQREQNLRRIRNGTHQFLRNENRAKNFYYERLFDDVFSEDFIRDVVRTTTSTLRVFDGWDPEDLSELYREKFAFECDFINDELNVDFEIDEEHHYDQIDYDYERDALFLSDRATLTFRYRLFDILSREQEVREDMRFVILELRKENRNVRSKFEYSKDECKKKWNEYFQMKSLKGGINV